MAPSITTLPRAAPNGRAGAAIKKHMAAIEDLSLISPRRMPTSTFSSPTLAGRPDNVETFQT